MDQSQVIDKVKKLLAVADSHSQLGQPAVARTYRQKANQLMATHNISVAMLKRKPAVSGIWECSCGFSIELKVDAGDATDGFVALMLNPHRLPGHNLRQR